MSERLNSNPEDRVAEENPAETLKNEKSFDEHMTGVEKAEEGKEQLSERDEFIKRAGEEYRGKADEKMQLAARLIKDGNLYAAQLVMKGEPDNKKKMYQGREAYSNGMGNSYAQMTAEKYGDTTGWDYSVEGYKMLAATKESEAGQLYDAEQEMLAEIEEIRKGGFSDEAIQQAASESEKRFRGEIGKKIALAEKLTRDGKLYAAGLVLHGEPGDRKKRYQGLEAYSDGMGNSHARMVAEQYGDTTGWNDSVDGFKLMMAEKLAEESAFSKEQEEMVRQLGNM